MHRLTLSVLALAAMATAPALSAGGAYSSLNTANSAACARACADDGLCMAWVRHASGVCELNAVVPGAAPAEASDFGLASRAPAFADFRPRTPLVVPGAEATPQPLAPLPRANETVTEISTPETEADLLLGGPAHEDIRLRLGARQ